jgi:hypothetical protein
MKILAKTIGFISGAFVGVLVTAILLEMNRIDRGPIPGLAGLALGALCWKLIGKSMEPKE